MVNALSLLISNASNYFAFYDGMHPVDTSTFIYIQLSINICPSVRGLQTFFDHSGMFQFLSFWEFFFRSNRRIRNA